MAKLFYWNGPSKHELGRFGKVNNGAPLLLTDSEAEGIDPKDKRYRPAKAGMPFPADQAGDIERLELEQKPREELKERCRSLGIAFTPLTNRYQLVRRILEAVAAKQPA